jgi:hypothetical protein
VASKKLGNRKSIMGTSSAYARLNEFEVKYFCTMSFVCVYMQSKTGISVSHINKVM